MKELARPRDYLLYRMATPGEKAKCYIHCFPQQRWLCTFSDQGVILENQGVTIIIPRTDFDKEWTLTATNGLGPEEVTI